VKNNLKGVADWAAIAIAAAAPVSDAGAMALTQFTADVQT
jgi:hypothetical protein